MASRSYARSIALYEESKRHLAGGVSSNVRYASAPVPLFFERAGGARMTDVDGNTYIDYVLGNGPAILGHAPPSVTRAVADTLALGQTYAAQHERELQLARRLTGLLPSLEVVRFATSGTEAVQAAMRLARAFTGRPKIVKFEGHYHGWTDSVYVSVRPSLNEAGPSQAPVPVAESNGQSASVLADLIVLGWNDLDALADTFARSGQQIAGVLMEPVLVNAGVIPPQAGYLQGVSRLCREHGALFLCDEVITGFRLGLGGAQALFDVRPDITIFAKAVAAGFPLAVIGGRRDVMDCLLTGNVMHGGTYNGNVQSMAAALAALDELARDDGAVYRSMHRQGTRLMEGLRAAARQHNVPMIVQGYPQILQTFFMKGSPPRTYRDVAAGNDRDRALAFCKALQEEGVRVNQRCAWFLSAAHDDAAIDETLAAVDRALARL
ncbi:MAG: aspartate aminotransferase family protein [Alphaproteobacteria bacterium]|nr:aspartate aminotransferase family protein [Alphaproteobacteria bacterium]